MTSWEINVFSDTRLLSRQNPAVKWNTNWFWAAKEVIQLSSRCLSPFSKSKTKIYKTYEGHKTQFFCFEAQRASRKIRIDSNPKFLHSKCCLGLWPISQVSESKNCKIRVARKKIRFSTISPEIEIFEFTHFLLQIWPAISG